MAHQWKEMDDILVSENYEGSSIHNSSRIVWLLLNSTEALQKGEESWEWFNW